MLSGGPAKNAGVSSGSQYSMSCATLRATPSLIEIVALAKTLWEVRPMTNFISRFRAALLVLGFLFAATTAAVSVSTPAHAELRQCVAQTFCPQTGRLISCAVYADPFYGQTCTFEFKYGYGVRCQGWDLFGSWAVYQDYCF